MRPDDLVFPFINDELWVDYEGGPLTLGALGAVAAEAVLAVGNWQGRDCWTADSITLSQGGAQPVGLRSRLGVWPEALFQLAGRAAQLNHFVATHRYCGRCGTATEAVSGEIARRCPACELTCYPRISPCIIVAVWRPGEILLARHHRHRSGIHTVLAGFVEAGETAEQALHREVLEEVGVQVAEPCYVGSQPWPFPHSLMLAYTARWQAGEIRVDASELEDAAWYRLDELPLIAPPGTVARRLIDLVIAQQAVEQP